ncbi:MAG: methyltransferase domain-containing protein [Proteobacteria bacterium]|nr:methyltransferase domain-containing protein [Pseudomonadota bacterium]
MTTDYSSTVDVARAYYNSEDADNFYHLIWGGEDIHIGMYADSDESIPIASRRTVAYLAAKVDYLSANAQVLDLGSGFGGSARFLAANHASHVTALNLSEVENERHRQMNREAGLDDRIEVVDGSFEGIPCGDGTFDIVWSQDAILHGGHRDEVLKEVDRVLKKGGEFILTYPMQADHCPEGVLQPILDRIHLETLGSPGFYADQARKLGWRNKGFRDFTPHLITHYTRVLEESKKNETHPREAVSEDYLDRMQVGLSRWIEGGQRCHLAWGVLHFVIS